MPLTAQDANRSAQDLFKEARPEWARLGKFVRYARGKQPLPWLPDDVESEYRDIAKKSASNWLELVIRASAQGLHVDGYGDATDDDVDEGEIPPTDPWSIFQANQMDAYQHALHRAVLTCGYGYVIVFPGENSMPWMRPEAATRLFARYEDPNDEWPLVAFRQVSKDRFELYDDAAKYVLHGKLGTATVETVEHQLEVCPITRMVPQLDLLGLPMGEVEPVISIQDRIVDATFMLQMAAKYGAFPQRWIAGITLGADADGNPLPPKIKAYIDHIILAADKDTKFGQFEAATLNQYIEALEAHIRHLAAVTQTPPHYLLGALVNLSAEALAAAEAGRLRKLLGYRESLGEGYEQALRLAALAAGNTDAASDSSSQVHWQDVESRSLAQTADALLKLATLGVPVQMLLEMIPGWTQQDVDKAIGFIEEGGQMDKLIAGLLDVPPVE